MTERTLRISAKMAEEIQQWASDELSQWPRDTAYAADLESLLAQLTAAQPAPDAVAEAAKVLLSDNDAVTELAVETYRHNQPDAGGKRRGYRPSVIAALQSLAKGPSA